MAREREWKFDLGGEAAALRLEARLGPAERARLQANRFFDTAGRDLRRARWALRLRAEWELDPEAALPDAGAAPVGAPARAILSLKGAREGSGAFHDRREEQVILPPAAWAMETVDARVVPASWRDLLPVAASGLVEVARFSNLRRTFPLADRWRAEVDRTDFGGGRRAWELELEIGPGDDPEEAHATLALLCGAAGISPQPQERSKLQRALEAD
ncbi:MAG: CYTH domain-containing protein [Desulfobacteraceae bacterium]|nr:MAG: CYTH domain-containing protein [Desulfobacteraceae bacterium]